MVESISEKVLYLNSKKLPVILVIGTGRYSVVQLFWAIGRLLVNRSLTFAACNKLFYLVVKLFWAIGRLLL